jgi:hypothetical protein
MFSAVFLTLAVGVAFAQQMPGQRSILERKMWYVSEAGKVGEALYWSIYLGDYDVKLTRNVPGKGQVTATAGMNFQFLSSGYIEGNGAGPFGSESRVKSLPGMRIRVSGGQPEEIKLAEIDYIYDYCTKVVAKDGRRGDFMIGSEGGENLEVKRFQVMEYKQVKGKFGELELQIVQDRAPIIGISFSREGAVKASKEPVTDY